MKKSQHQVNPHLIIQFQDVKTYFSLGAPACMTDSRATKKHTQKKTRKYSFRNSTIGNFQEIETGSS
jgi:hypothetical protein